MRNTLSGPEGLVEVRTLSNASVSRASENAHTALTAYGECMRAEGFAAGVEAAAKVADLFDAQKGSEFETQDYDGLATAIRALT